MESMAKLLAKRIRAATELESTSSVDRHATERLHEELINCLFYGSYRQSLHRITANP